MADDTLLPESVSEAAPAVKNQILQQRLRPADLAQATDRARGWLWHGYLAAGKITLLTSQWKSGKTTLISILLARMGQGGQLAGLAVAPGRVAVVSEEGVEDWDARCRKLQIGCHVSFFCQPFPARPTMEQWQGLLGALLELKQTEGLELVVIDSLSIFLPGETENVASVVIKSLQPVRALTAAGLSVLLVHHPGKDVKIAGQAARGSGALGSFVDILIEKSWYGQPEDDDRRRFLRSFSRHTETPSRRGA
jgi:RecA-family ATPase